MPLIQAAEIWLFKTLVDEVFVPRDLGPLPALATLFVLLNLFAGALGFVDQWLSAWAGERFILRLRDAIFRHLLALSPLQVRRRAMGDLLTRLSGDVGSVEAALVAGPPTVIENAVRIVVFVGMLFWLDPLLAAVALVTAPAVWLLARRFSGRIRVAAREKRRRTGRLQSVAEEVLAAHPQVRAAGAEEHEAQRFAREADAARRAELEATRVSAFFTPLVDLFELAGALAVVSAGAWSLSSGRLTLGELLAFLTFLTHLYTPMRELTALTVTVHKAAAGAERLLEVLDERPAVPAVPAALARPDELVAPIVMAGAVTFTEVSFRYEGADSNALDRVSFRAEPRSVTAIVGPSGSGKSTLVALLLRMADPHHGSIHLDDDALTSLSPAALRSRIGVLLQDSYLFDGTVADNIAYPPSVVSEGTIADALAAADALDFVAALPDGVLSRVGPKGSLLSGGERRRLALARVLFDRRPVLVLDEFSAGLHPDSVQTALRSLRATKCTVLLITHDPAIVAAADHVVTLERGRVVDPRPVVTTP